MPSDLELFYEEFMQETIISAGSLGNFIEPTFTENMCELLEQEGFFSEYNTVNYKKHGQGIKVDAWTYDFDHGVLNLIVSDFTESEIIETLSNADLEKNFKRAENFFQKSLKITFSQDLDESNPASSLADLIFRFQEGINKIKFTLITNQKLSSRIKSIEKLKLLDYDIQRDVWDIERIFRAIGGVDPDPIMIDFDKNPLPILPAHTGKDSFQSYLLVLPGSLLASLYADYGDRLLEQNVRTFLQFRGKINKGLRKTILSSPEMFFAYNNGITATAESVEINELNGHHELKSISNLQIVNGGQTTASLFTTSVQNKNDADLDKVFVQMKLTIIKSDEINDDEFDEESSKIKASSIISNISEFSNTQNKVNAADLSSNHEFHVRMEAHSRRIWAPAKQSTPNNTKWFYERLRGQFNNLQSNLSPANKRKFLAENPRPQLLVKTDLAKILHSWEKLPQAVSHGAQKNFVWFIEGNKKYQLEGIQKEWDKNEKRFHEDYFKNIVVMAILFRGLDKLIMKQSWYDGYKANIVTYSIAKLRDIIDSTGKELDFEAIWKLQETPITITNLLLEIADEVNTCIRSSSQGNVTEYCKKDSCWDEVKKLKIDFELELINKHLISKEKQKEKDTDAQKKQKLTDSLEIQIYVNKKGADYWKEILTWGQEKGLLGGKEIGILETASMMPRKIPSEQQCKVILDIEAKIEEEGFVSSSS
jgi:hypothetical protein